MNNIKQGDRSFLNEKEIKRWKKREEGDRKARKN